MTLTDKKSSITVTVTAINVHLASRASIIFRHRLAVSIKTNTEHIPSLLDGETFILSMPFFMKHARNTSPTSHVTPTARLTLLLGADDHRLRSANFNYALKTEIATAMLFIRAAILTFAKLFSFTVILHK